VENVTGGVQSVARIFSLIEVLSAHPAGASLQTISAESGLPKSTTHRLLSSLAALGYIVQDSFTTHYRLTLKMFELSSGIVNDMDILSVAKPHLDKLSRHTGEAVHLVIQDGCDVVYIYKADPGTGGMRMRSQVGMRIPMYCTGVGKAILATQSYGEAERVWRKSNIRPLTTHTITTFEGFIDQLKCVRMAGYAIDDEENELGIRCVALAVPGMNGRAEAAFSISGLAAQMTPSHIEHLAQMSLAARTDILRDLGWR
jgi:DNA-binding IclR family transcriptional regulator